MHDQLRFSLAFITLLSCITYDIIAQGVEGYYRQPEIHDNTVYFVAEGDIWKVPLTGGMAQRLTTHPGEELHPAVSPNGQSLAFSARYEGPREVYVMDAHGGLPRRLTYEPESSTVNTWTPDGKIVYETFRYATLPDEQLVEINPVTNEHTRVPLSRASEASYGSDGTLYFVQPGYHRNVTKRYKGGTARQIWKYSPGATEAVRLTNGYDGESHHPLWWNNRVYFISDRDGIMNVWSLSDNGSDLQQHTVHTDFDVRSANMHNGNIVYQQGADIWHLDAGSGEYNKIPIRLMTDLDQLREYWVNKPIEYLTSVDLNHTGDKVVLTARGRVFVAPVKDGRFIQVSRKQGVRYRDAVFLPESDSIVTLSDESGEFEFVSIPHNGIGTHTALTNNGTTLRYKGVPSPDGQWIAFDDLNNRLFILNIATGDQRLISTNQQGIGGFTWSPDGKWLAFEQTADNTFRQILISSVTDDEIFPITTDRANSRSPVWSPDGKFIYFLSDRNFQTLVGSPWGPRQPEPYFDRKYKVYHIALQAGIRSPFRAEDELLEQIKDKSDKNDKDSEDSEQVSVSIDREGIAQRIMEVPVDPGNYRALSVTKDALYVISSGTGIGSKSDLCAISITNDNPKVKTVASDIRSYQISGDQKKMLIQKSNNIYVTKVSTSSIDKLDDDRVNLSQWKFPIDVREDWNQLYTDAWRMERDYFYDPGMHGVDWDAMYEKYIPLRDRVTTRSELSDVIGRFVGELSALHTSVRGGDMREGPEDISIASLGARLTLDIPQGGYRIDYIYKADPDYPDERSPLDDPILDISEGDVITAVDGEDVLNVAHIGALLRNKASKQVHLSVKSADGPSKEVIVVPMSGEFGLRYRDWKYSRRLTVDKESNNTIGYVHLSAMGSGDIGEWYREFYPAFNRAGLIVDVRHNNGGNIESFILEKLMRRAWMYWSDRSSKPRWNMQYAFRGHVVVLCDEDTASDGEAFCDGFRRLGLGKAIGKRTWGGEIWLNSNNRLSDGGLARAPMYGVYSAEGEWLIEGHGFVPDIEVDNPPHATFNGEDAQLNAAIDYLKAEIAKDPRPVPPVPPYPDKSFN